MDIETTLYSTETKKIENACKEAFSVFEQAIFESLKTYSNVERGKGHYSQVTSALLEQARVIILKYLKLREDKYIVIFCSPRGAEILIKGLSSSDYLILTSKDIGLPLGLRALVVKKKAVPKGIPVQTGGGMIKLVSPNSLVLADIPERFEAGTPPVMNIISFIKALLMGDLFKETNKNEIKNLNASTVAEEILFYDELHNYSGKELLVKLRESMPAGGLKVPVTEGEKRYVNFDNAASTPAFSPVWDVVCQTLQQSDVIHQEIISRVKEICADFLDAPSTIYDVLFCSNTTEAINIAAENIGSMDNDKIKPVVLNTFLEHHSNELPWRYLPNALLLRLCADNEGFVCLKELENLLKEYNLDCNHGNRRIRLVAVSGASNVTGAYNNVKSIAQIAHKYKACILVDGAQLIAHRKIFMLADEIDYLAFSGHKMYAPFGSGVLIARKNMLYFKPEEFQKIKASGEENVVGIAALGKAMILLQRIGLQVIMEEEITLTRCILQDLLEIKGIEIFGVKDVDSVQFKNRGGIVVFRLNHVPHNLVSKELAEEGAIGVRTGCFCAHLITKQLMKIHPFRSYLAEIILKYTPFKIAGILPGIVRVSLGIENDINDVNRFIETMKNISMKKRSFIDRFIASVYNGTPFLPHTRVQEQTKRFTKKMIENVYFLKKYNVTKSKIKTSSLE